VGIQDDFFDLGGNSLLAARMFALMNDELSQHLPLVTLLHAPTIALLAERLQETDRHVVWDTIVPLQAEGNRRPLFLVHGRGGGVLGYAELVRYLGPDQPVYGLQAAGLDGRTEPDSSIEEAAARYCNAIQLVQPTGPYHLGGYCLGSVVAYETARQLVEQGHQVGLVAIIEGAAPSYLHVRTPLYSPRRLRTMWSLAPYWFRDYRSLGASEVWRRVRVRMGRARRHVLHRIGLDVAEGEWDARDPDLSMAPEYQRRVMRAHRQARLRYRPRPYAGRVVLYRSRGQTISKILFGSMDPQLGWGALAEGGVEVKLVEGSHRNVHLEPHVSSLGSAIRSSLEQEQNLG
jgi:thioesterase domain-containing protein